MKINEELLPWEAREQNILVKDEKASKREKKTRSMQELLDYGIINVNKPAGPTSHQVADMVKKITGSSKAGHSGTLDPKVTGALPIALEKATRIVQTLLPAGKEYVAMMRLHSDVSQKKIEAVFKKFQGKISQLPPVRSAVKRQVRERKIYYLTLMEMKEKVVLFRVGCQGGTYIRKLIHDMGKELNTGAHMAQLVRTKAGPFTEQSMCSLQDLKDAMVLWKEKDDETLLRKYVQPYETAVQYTPKVWVFDSAVQSICHGAPLGVAGIATLTDDIEKGMLVAVMTSGDELICLGKAVCSSKAIKKQSDGLAVKTEKVFMERSPQTIKE